MRFVYILNLYKKGRESKYESDRLDTQAKKIKKNLEYVMQLFPQNSKRIQTHHAS